MNCFACNRRSDKTVGHTGGAVGASSVLTIQLPRKLNDDQCITSKEGEIKGVVVAMITNLQDASLSPTARKLTSEFTWMMDS